MIHDITSQFTSACAEGNQARLQTLLDHPEATLNANIFVGTVFELHWTIKEYIRQDMHLTLIPGACEQGLTGGQKTIEAIEMVMRQKQHLFDAETAGKALAYACCICRPLVPIILELFSDRLLQDSIIRANHICAHYCPSICQLIMTACAAQMSKGRYNSLYGQKQPVTTAITV